MAVSIDERVVEMRFNNKQFEEGVKKSMKSLNDLDQSIDKLDNNGLDNLVAKLNAVDFTKIESSLGSLEKRFSSFGVVGMTIIQKLTNGVMDLTASMAKFVSKPFDIMATGGWQRALNIEDAKFQLKGLGIAWEKVSEDINYAVDGTAYGLDAAAKACSQLSASGVQAGEDMKKALRGISGVAAMANTEYENIAPIFTTVAGQGKLMTMQLRQLESRGLNAAAELGKALGKTETQVRDMVSDGKIDFKTFADAMDEAFGEHAKDANQTFNGSLANMKAALKKIGAEVATEIMQDSIDVFNATREAINIIKGELLPIIQNDINPVIKRVIKGLAVAISMISKTESFKEFIRDIGAGLADIMTALRSSAFDFFLNLKPIINNLKAIGDAISIIYQNITGSDKKLRISVVLIKLVNGLFKGILITLNAITFVLKNVMETLANSGLGGFIKVYLLPLAKFILPAILAALVLSKLHLLKIVGIIGAVTAGIMVLIRLDLLKYVLGIAKGIGVIAMALGSIVALFVNKIVSIVGFIRNFGFAEAIKQLKFEIINFFNVISSGAVSAAKGLVCGILYILATPYRLVKSLINFILTTEGPLGRVRDFVVTVFGVVKKNGGLVLGFIQGLLQGLMSTKPVFLIIGASMIALLGVITGITKAITSFSSAFKNLTESFKELSKIPSQVTGTLKEMAESANTMAKAELRKQTIGLIIAFAGALVVLAGAAALITKLIPDPSDFFTVAAGITAMGMALAAIVGVVSFVKSKADALKQATDQVQNVFQSIAAIGREFAKDIAKSIMVKSIGAFLISVAALIGTLTVSLIALNKNVPDSRYIEDVVIAMAKFVGAIGIVAAIIAGFASKSMATGMAIAAFSGMFLAIAGAFIMMAHAVEKFQSLAVDMKLLVKTLVAIGVASVALIAITALVAQAFKNVTMNIVALAVSVAALILVMKTAPDFIRAFGLTLTSVLNAFKEITWQQGAVIAAIMAAVGATLIGMTLVSRMASHGIRTILVVTAVIGGLVAMLVVLKKFGDDQAAIENIVSAFDQLKGVMYGIAGCLAIIFAAAGQAKYALRAMLLLVSLPIVLISLIGEFKLLAIMTKDMDPTLIDRVIQIFVGFSAVLAIVLAFSGLAGSKAWATVLALTSTIVALTFCVGALAMLYDAAPIQTLDGALTMCAVILSLTLLMKSIGDASGGFMGGKNPIMGTLLALVAVIGIAGAVAYAVLNVTDDWRAVVAAFAGIDSMIIAMAVTVDILGHVVQSLSNYDKKTGRVIVMFFTTMIATLAAALALKIALSNDNTNWSAAAAAAVGMSVMILAMALVVQVLAKTSSTAGYNWKRTLQACGSLLLVTLSLYPIAWAIEKLAGLPYAEMLAATGSLALVLLGLTAALAILTKLGDGTTLIMSAAGLMMLGTSLAVLAGGLSLLAQCDEGKIWAAAGAIGALTLAMGLIVGALVLFPEAAVAVIPTLGAIAVAFISAAASAAIIALSITAVTGALTFFLNFLIENKDTISDALTQFGAGILGFISNVAVAIKIAAIEAANTVMGVAVALADGLFKLLDTVVVDLGKVGESIIKTIRSFMNTLTDQIATGAYNGVIILAGAIRSGVEAMWAIVVEGEEVGKWVKTSFIEGISDPEGYVYAAAFKLGQDGYNGLHDGSTTGSLSKAIMTIGNWMDRSLVVGLSNGSGAVYQSGFVVGNNAVEGLRDATDIHSISDIIKGIGEWFDKSFDAGIIDWVAGGNLRGPVALGKKALELLGNAIDGKSGGGGKVGSNFGKSIAEGGIKGAVDYIKGKGKSKIEEGANAIGDMIGGSTGKSVSNYLLSAIGLTDSLTRKQDLYNQALKNTNEMLARQEDFRRAAEQEAESMSTKDKNGNYRVRVYAESTPTYRKAVQKEYERLAAQASGTGGFLDEFMKQIQDGLPTDFPGGDDLLKSLEGLSGGAEDTTTSLYALKASLMSASDGFKTFDRSVNVSVKDIMSGLKSQNRAISEYQMGIETLAARGYSKGVIKEILDMGVEQGYEYVAALVNDKDKKTVKEINRLYRKNGTIDKRTMKWMERMYTKDGKSLSNKFIEGAVEPYDVKNNKAFEMGVTVAELTGKALNTALKEKLSGINIKKYLDADKSGSLGKALDTYLEASASKSKNAKNAFKEYITEAYLATLDETDRQEALNKSSKKLAKDVSKWWKEQEKAVKETTINEIRSMEDLTNAYKKTGKELIAEYTKQGTDYLELQADRQYTALAAKLAGASEDMISYITDTMSIEDILGFIQLASEVGGEEAGRLFVESFNTGVDNNHIDFDVTMSKGSKEDQRRLLNDLGDNITKIKGYDELFEDTVNGITDGINSLIVSDKALVKMSGRITAAFPKIDDTAIDAGTAALNQYMLSLIDYDAVLEEVKVTGVDVSTVVKTHLDTISDQVIKWKDSLSNTLKTAVQSFNEFDVGEKQSLDNMMKNLQGNITKLNEWRANIKKMQQLGYSQSLIDYMASQGLSSYQDVAALTGEVSQHQIDEINQMWGQAADQSEESAVDAFGAVAVAVDTVGRDTVDGWIQTVKEQYANSKESLKETVADTTETAVSDGLTSTDVETPAKVFTQNLSSAILKFLINPSVNSLPVGVTEYAAKYLGVSLGNTVEKTGNSAKKKAKNKGKQIGKQGVLGVVEGLNSAKPALGKALDALVDNAVNRVKNKLDIHSPSRVFAWIGEQTVEGFAVGFGNNAYRATNEVDELSNSLIAYAQKLSEDLAEAVPAEDDFTIKPVLDLDNLQNANSMIQSLLGNGDIAVRSNALAGSISTNSDWSMLSKVLSGIGGNSTTNTYGDIQITVNAPDGADANEIANAVMAKIQQSIDRRKYV